MAELPEYERQFPRAKGYPQYPLLRAVLWAAFAISWLRIGKQANRPNRPPSQRGRRVQIHETSFSIVLFPPPGSR